MSPLGGSVTGQRWPGLGICPVCGAAASGAGRSGAYCSPAHFEEARRRARSGESWQPHANFTAAIRGQSNADKVPGMGRSKRTQQRRARRAAA